MLLIGKPLDSIIQGKIKNKEYTIPQLKELYNKIQLDENNGQKGLIIDAIGLFFIFALIAFGGIKLGINILVMILISLGLYGITMLVLYLLSHTAYKKFMKMLNNYYQAQFDEITTNSYYE